MLPLWRLMGSRTQAEARGVFMQHVQRSWSAASFLPGGGCTGAHPSAKGPGKVHGEERREGAVDRSDGI